MCLFFCIFFFYFKMFSLNCIKTVETRDSGILVVARVDHAVAT